MEKKIMGYGEVQPDEDEDAGLQMFRWSGPRVVPVDSNGGRSFAVF